MKKLNKYFLIGLFLGVLLVVGQASQVFAAECPGEKDPTRYECFNGCRYLGDCVANRRCILVPPNSVYPGSKTCGSAIMGSVKAPQGVPYYNINAGRLGAKIGILNFFSRLLRIFTIISGLWVFGNLVAAGVEYIIGAGGADKMSKINQKITFSIVGLAIIVSAYAVAGVMGAIFFGDASFIIKPNIEQYGALTNQP